MGHPLLRKEATMSDRPLDEQALQAKMGLLGGVIQNSAMLGPIVLGLRLGLYEALADANGSTSEQLASSTGLHERWVREWLRQQACAALVDYAGDGRFTISPESAALLADRDGPRWMGGTFYSLPLLLGNLVRLEDSFRTGVGLTWDDRGAEAAHATEQGFRTWHQHQLVPVALPALAGVVAKLKAGAVAADVGCGGGVAVVEMAKAFPKSEFHGYDISEAALDRAGGNVRAAGVTNAQFHNVRDEPLPEDGRFDLVTTFDVLHDMTAPAAMAGAVRRGLKADGTWLIADINGQPTFEDNLAKNPLARMMYAMSIMSCMSSATSEPGGAGLGTLGLPEPAMRELVGAAGFTRFRRVDLPHPVNAFYEARP
jgi:2-polyprenyl-3-methyl-5-hydroxy-6-metoxy-1,4-benzoquinol methylase